MNSPFLDTFTFAVDNSYGMNIGLQTLCKIFLQKIGNILGPECMEIQHIFDGYFYRFHISKNDFTYKRALSKYRPQDGNRPRQDEVGFNQKFKFDTWEQQSLLIGCKQEQQRQRTADQCETKI